jgi:hypothetical protein
MIEVIYGLYTVLSGANALIVVTRGYSRTNFERVSFNVQHHCIPLQSLSNITRRALDV